MIKAQHLSFWPYSKSPDRFLLFSARYLRHIDGKFPFRIINIENFGLIFTNVPLAD
jgi:hypothetical protein